MVARITTGKSIRGILKYNEEKVSEGKAEFIHSSGFAKETNALSSRDKISRFEMLTKLKPKLKTNALHITLNFETSEKLTSEKMAEISAHYMERIGFGQQPYLTYRHNDVAHQHIHIATVSIKKDGSGINLHNIGKRLSEPARKETEKAFNLHVAGSKKDISVSSIKTISPDLVSYGERPTKRAISNAVYAVMKNYKYASLAEFNAGLACFNVAADRGEEASAMYKKKGLVYFVLNKKSEKTGVPIKASSFHFKPTLMNLEKRFEKNREERKVFRALLSRKIDNVLLQAKPRLVSQLQSELKEEGIDTILRKSKTGQLFGLTFIDHANRVIFNGSELGKAYAAKAISERFGQEKTAIRVPVIQQSFEPNRPITEHQVSPDITLPNILASLLAPTDIQQPLSLPKRKKKKRRGLRL